jgi:glycerophosphoryl diester phosphodiesterase
MTLAELRRYRVERNPDPARFPAQDASITSRAQRFADQRGIDPYTPPTLAELLEFAAAFSRPVRMDLELKRVPGHPETIGDDFDGTTPGLLELRVVEAVHAAGFIAQTTVRSFDHRSVRAIKALEPRLMTAVLIAGTAPVDPVGMVCAASADLYCPEVHFLDELQVRQCHEAGIRVLPWTVNDPDDWRRLLDWGVDGMTTDYPDRLAEALRQRGIAF